MCKDVLITGVTVKQQMNKAKKILKEKVIPMDKDFQKRKRTRTLSSELLAAMKADA